LIGGSEHVEEQKQRKKVNIRYLKRRGRGALKGTEGRKAGHAWAF